MQAVRLQLQSDSFRQIVNSVHGTGIVDVVRGYQRSIESTGPRSMKELDGKLLHIRIPGEHPLHPQILSADVRTEVFPLRLFRRRRWLVRIRTNVTEPTRHAYTIGPDQLLVVVIRGVCVKALWVPPLLRSLVKIGIRKEP